MFKVGQKARIKGTNSIIKITGIETNGIEITGIDGNLVFSFPEDGYKYWRGYADELVLVNSFCPVCGQEIAIENNKIKEHKHNNEICYGSYTPYEV